MKVILINFLSDGSKGSRNSVEIGAVFALPQKRGLSNPFNIYFTKVQAPYRKIEIEWIT